MAFAFVQEFEVDPDDRSTTNYDAVAERLGLEADLPDGLIVHTAGFTGDGVFRIFDVWESVGQAQRFRDERLNPILEEGPRDSTNAAPPSRDYSYELHDVARS